MPQIVKRSMTEIYEISFISYNLKTSLENNSASLTRKRVYKGITRGWGTDKGHAGEPVWMWERKRRQGWERSACRHLSLSVCAPLCECGEKLISWPSLEQVHRIKFLIYSPTKATEAKWFPPQKLRAVPRKDGCCTAVWTSVCLL